ncbi:peptidoglycan editing factor PgeF [Fusobacterium sp. PH5-44]|uniref:peptidoglycan editing factor PgeF n=1 Tax=unclassified Fusobacterium TaxID=2648384 RepID=UPI003D1DC88A
MYIDKDNYLISEELLQYGISIIYTDRNFGDAKTIEKEYIKNFFDINDKVIVSGHQVHGTNIEIIKNTEKIYFENTDGFITDIKNVALFTKYADCLPIFFFDKQKKIIGVVHSGWAGTCDKISLIAIDLFIRYYNSMIEDIIVVFGIGISWENYEVGFEFLEKFKKNFSSDIIKKSFFYENNKIYFDNLKFNYLMLIDKGILPENIFTNNLCTYSDNRFFSHRRDNSNSGRNGALIFFNTK